MHMRSWGLEINDFLCKWGAPGSFTWRKLWFYMEMSSWGVRFLKEIINELMWILRLIYFKKSLMSYANGLLGFPGPIYLKRSWISYSNELLGIPRLTYLKKMLYVCGRREADSLKESCDFLCKWVPGITRSSFTSRNKFRILMQTSSWASPGPPT